MGRPAKTYDINPDEYLLIGVDINPESYRAVIIDMRCRVVHSINRMMIGYEVESIISSVKTLINDVLIESGIRKKTVLGIAKYIQMSYIITVQNIRGRLPCLNILQTKSA